MIKKLIAAVLCILLTCCLSGCGKNAEQSPKDIVNNIRQNVSFGDLTEISGDKLSGYFSFSDVDVGRYSVTMGVSGETADIVAAFEYENADQRTKIVDGISKYLTNASGSFKKTMESEHKKLQNRVLVELSNVIVLVVASDYAGATNLLTDMGAKPLS